MGHADRVAGDGKGLGRVILHGHHASTALVELLDLWQACLGTGRVQGTAVVKSGAAVCT